MARYIDAEIIRRFLGVVEGVAVALPENTQSLLFDYIEVIDGILNREDEGGEQNDR